MNKNNLALILACLALGLSMFAFFRSSAPVSASVTVADSTEMEHEELEVAVLMQRFQWNVNKLYFAGMAGNKPLAGFYLHELEESMEELAEHPIEENGQRLDDLSGDAVGDWAARLLRVPGCFMCVCRCLRIRPP